MEDFFAAIILGDAPGKDGGEKYLGQIGQIA